MESYIIRCSHGRSLFRAFKPIPLSLKTRISKPRLCSNMPTQNVNGGSVNRAYDALLLDAGGTLLQLAKPIEETYASIGSKYGKQLMLRIAELVPKHPGRTKKQEPASSSTAGSSKSGKGGRKKK